MIKSQKKIKIESFILYLIHEPKTEMICYDKCLNQMFRNKS